MWVVALTDPDDYRIDFESPTDAPEQTQGEETHRDSGMHLEG